MKNSVYYLGCLVGCLLGGWIAEKVGRIKVIFFGTVVAVVGASLQCSAQSPDWMICGKKASPSKPQTECIADPRKLALSMALVLAC